LRYYSITKITKSLFLNRAKTEDQLHGVVPHLVDGGFLQYADDTIFLLEHNLE